MNAIKKGEKKRVVVLGAGTAVPAPQRSPASVLLQYTNFTALLDMGPGTIAKLPLYGVDVLTLQNIFISHLHPDHTLDLATFFMICDYASAERGDLPLNLIGCVGLEDFVLQFMSAFPDIALPSEQMKIKEVLHDDFYHGGMRIRSALSGHTATSVSFRFDIDNKSVVYTSDCVQNTALETLCEEADVLISECSYPDGWKTTDHMNAQTLGRMAENARVKRLIVTHQYPPALKVNLEEQIKQYYSGSVLIAEDGCNIELD